MFLTYLHFLYLKTFLQVGLGQLHYQGGRGVEMDHAVRLFFIIFL